MVPSI